MAISAMIVDDHAEIRLLMRMFVDSAKLGLSVVCEAASGVEALDKLEACDPEVIVLDQMMPGLSGLETAERILERRPDQHLVLCSAYVDDHLCAEAERLGFAAVVRKQDIPMLPQTIRQAVGL